MSEQLWSDVLQCNKIKTIQTNLRRSSSCNISLWIEKLQKYVLKVEMTMKADR